MSAETGTYLFRLLLNFVFFPEIFFTLINSAYPDELPHDGISLVYNRKKNMNRKIFTIEMQPNIFLKLFLVQNMYAFTGCNLRVGKFDVSASNIIIFGLNISWSSC